MPRPCQLVVYPCQAPSHGHSFCLLRVRTQGTTPLGSSARFIAPSFCLSSLGPRVCPTVLLYFCRSICSCSVTQTGKLTQVKNNNFFSFFFFFFCQIILNPDTWVVQMVWTGLQSQAMDTDPNNFNFSQDVAVLVNCCQLMSSQI